MLCIDEWNTQKYTACRVIKKKKKKKKPKRVYMYT